MSELKNAFEKGGFKKVSTYINSGNVIFESPSGDIKEITRKICALLKQSFFTIKTIIIPYRQLINVLKQVPVSWNNNDVRKYIAFIAEPSTPEDVIKAVSLKPGIDFIETGTGVVYMTTKMSGLTTSGFPKLVTKPVYKDITIRNFNTVTKLAQMMKV